MADFHFVQDYEKLVTRLIETLPLEKAMEMAVGGNYEHFGTIELDVLKSAGLRNGMSILDIGCGSGRLATAIGKAEFKVSYTGLDVVQSMLDFAAAKSPGHFLFKLSRQLELPVPDCSIDLACAFSVFTHLLHQESYIYIEDTFRCLRPGGKLIFSFLEFAEQHHWHTFVTTVDQTRAREAPHLNTFIERSVIELWASRLGFQIDRFISGNESVNGGYALGQAIVVLHRPELTDS